MYGVAGLGFAGANLILARVLPAVEYGLFTLVTALVNLAFSLAPTGLDSLVLRQRIPRGAALLGRTLRATTLVALLFGLIGLVAYSELSPPLLIMLMVSTIAGGAMMVAAAQFQSEQRFGISLALLQSPNVVALVAALVVLAVGGKAAWFPLLIATIGFIGAALVGWGMLFREPGQDAPQSDSTFRWGEALSLAGVQASGLLLIQLDRMVIPHVLPIHDLAVYGVLAAIAGSLFRVLQMGVGYSLVPRLRAAPDVAARRRLIAHEARLTAGIVLVGSGFIWFVTPLIERWFLAGKYHLAGSLVLAMIVAGITKILGAFSRCTISAVGDERELRAVNLIGWVSVGVALLASVIGARWGLAGLIYGVALGWLVRAIGAYWLTVRHLRLPAVPVTTPEPRINAEAGRIAP